MKQRSSDVTPALRTQQDRLSDVENDVSEGRRLFDEFERGLAGLDTGAFWKLS